MPDVGIEGLILPPLPNLLSAGIYGAGGGQSRGGGASAAWPVANSAIFVPIRLPKKRTVQAFGFFNGGTLSGNLDVGVYTLGGKRLVSIGSTAQAGANVVQKVTLGTPFVLPAGAYYLAMALDNATGTNFRSAPAAGLEYLKQIGLCEMAAAFPLPATATLAALTSNYEPCGGLFFRSTP